VINEPLRFPLRPKLDHGHEVAEYEGYEHVYFLHQYLRAVRAAGFSVTLPDLEGLGVRRLPRFVWRYAIRGEANLALIGSKVG
jgi:hypothetical protein